MKIAEQLKSDLKEALIAKDASRASVIRMVLATIKNREIEKGSELEDAEVEKLIKTEVKKVKDSISQFLAAGREDLVAKEEASLPLYESYLPEQASEEDIRKVVLEVIVETSAAGMKDMGRVMGMSIKRFGTSADGSVVSSIVKEELSKI